MNDHKGFVFGLHVWKESCTQNFFRLGLSQLKSVEEFSHESFLCFVSTIESFVLNLSRLCLPPKQSDRSKFLLDLFGGSIQGLRHSSHASYLPPSASTLLCWVCNVRLLYLDHSVVEVILTLIQLWNFAYIRLLDKPYENGVTLRGQNICLKYYQPREIMLYFGKGLKSH